VKRRALKAGLGDRMEQRPHGTAKSHYIDSGRFFASFPSLPCILLLLNKYIYIYMFSNK